MTNTIYQELEHGITTIDTGFIRPGFNAAHLIIEGGHAAFVDVGVSYAAPVLLQVLQEKQIAPEQVKYVILTHIHLDHAGGAGTLLRHLPEARVVVHPRGARHLIAPQRLIDGATAVYGTEHMQRLFGEVAAIPQERILKAEDQWQLDFNGRNLLFLDTAGHARHHVSIVDERSRGIFSGDTFGISFREFDTERGAFIFPSASPVHFDPDAMHQSIERFMRYEPHRMYLTHYGALTDLARLADALHDGIEQLVQLTAGIETSGEERTQELTKRMQTLLIQRAQEHGCQLVPSRMLELLKIDIALNVMGLEVWLDKTQKNKK